MRGPAHEQVNVGKYSLEIGWVNEPAVVVNVASKDGSVKPGDIDTSGLKVSVVYGSESKQLELQPLGEDTPASSSPPSYPLCRANTRSS